MNAKVEEQELAVAGDGAGQHSAGHRGDEARAWCGCRSDDNIRNFHKCDIFKIAVNDNIIIALSPTHCRLVCIHSPTLRLAKLQHQHTMDVEPLYCAEQIKVPEQLPAILKEWTKEVIRQNPRDINEFSAQYVSCLLRWLLCLLRLLVVAVCCLLVWY